MTAHPSEAAFAAASSLRECHLLSSVASFEAEGKRRAEERAPTTHPESCASLPSSRGAAHWPAKAMGRVGGAALRRRRGRRRTLLARARTHSRRGQASRGAAADDPEAKPTSPASRCHERRVLVHQPRRYLLVIDDIHHHPLRRRRQGGTRRVDQHPGHFLSVRRGWTPIAAPTDPTDSARTRGSRTSTTGGILDGQKDSMRRHLVKRKRCRELKPVVIYPKEEGWKLY